MFYNSQRINNVKWKDVNYGTITSNGVAHGIMPQALKDFPNINYKQYKWSAMHTSKTQTIIIIHRVNSTGLKPRSNPTIQHFKCSIKITT